MCAFGIIIGDTLPQVFRAVFPTLPSIPVLKVFVNRQFIIAFCTICFSYPLSLYRDIHKLARASGLALIGMVIIVLAVLLEGPHVPPEMKGDQVGKFSFIEPGIFQAIGVISFAFGAHAPLLSLSMKIYNWFSLPSQLSPNLRQSANTYSRPLCESDTCVNLALPRLLYDPGRSGVHSFH